jgi:nitrate reductase alpha subunit
MKKTAKSNTIPGKLSRRDVLKISGGLGLAALFPGCTSEEGLEEFDIVKLDPLSSYPYRGWETLYREKFTWDRVARSTHSANCTGSCSWKVYVKDGVMLREEQAADYPKINDDLPDYNPRGCNKGACFVEYVYGAQRVKYPLIRVGERGEGKWRRASWDEALEQIAEKLIDNIYNYGPDTNSFFTVIPAMSPVSFASGVRMAHYLGGVVCSFYDWYCDLPPGQPITWGVQTDTCETADWFNSKYIVLWGSNINATRIPDAHFAWEARYNGAKIAAISPDYNCSAIHCDQYLRIKPGMDSVLAMAVCRYLIDNDMIDVPYIKEQTDLPLLVRKDNKKFLRASDMGQAGEEAESSFYIWDNATNELQLVPGTMGNKTGSLLLEGLKPELNGSWSVSLASGEVVEVTTVFENLKVELSQDQYSLAGAAEKCGIPVNEVEHFAKEFGEKHPSMIIHGAGTNHWYHNDLFNRSMILIMAITGNVGVNGGGFNHYVGQEKIWPEHGFKTLSFPEGGKKQRFQNTTIWTYCHSLMQDPHLTNGKKIESYILDSVKKGWMPLYPKNDWENISEDQMHDLPRKPRSLFVWRANYLNQAKGNEALLKSLWQDLDLIVDVNYRMDTTALYSDIVLPASSYYEKTDLNSTDCHSFIHPFSKVLDPLFESKTDWDIFGELSKKIAEVAKAKGLSPFMDEQFGWERDLTKLYEDWSRNGELSSDEAACNHILSTSIETKGMTYKGLQENGPTRFPAADEEVWTSTVEEGRPFTPFLRHTEKKRPWHTLTGRQQFYIDHDWFLDLGEQLPMHKEPQEDSDYPMFFNTPHGRWSIHSTWRDNRHLLRLQRGVPIVYVHPDDAADRGIIDNDWIRVFGSAGEAVVKAKILPGEKKGRITIYHGWEKYLGFQKGGWQSLTYIKIKPTQLIGKYGHLNFKLNYWGPTGNNRDIKVDFEKYNGPVAPFDPKPVKL